MSDFEPVTTHSSTFRRLGIATAALLLVVLVASLAYHLIGKARFSAAVERFNTELGGVVPELTPSALEPQFAALAPPVPEASENAARWLLAGAQALVLSGTEVERMRDELSGVPAADWTPEQLAWAEQLVQRNRGGLDTLYRAVGLPGSSYEVDYADLAAAEIPDFLEVFRAGRFANLEARLAFAMGDVDRGIAALETLARMTQSLRDESILICSLVAHATERFLLQGIGEVLSSSQAWAANPELVARLGLLLPTDDLPQTGQRLVALDAAVTSWAALQGHEVPEWERVSRLEVFLTGHRQAAALLDLGRSAAALHDRPYGQHAELFAAVSEPETKSGLGSAYRDAIAKAQLAMSQRHLVAAAIEARQLGLDSGEYSANCPATPRLTATDPYTGQSIACRLGGDGSFWLAIPGAEELVASAELRANFWLFELGLPPLLEGRSS